jgi:uncharacterized protein YukE
MNNLITLGYTAEEAAKIMEKMGYTVTYTYEDHYIGDETGTDYGTKQQRRYRNGESVTKTSILVASGVKESAGGSGFNPPSGGGGGSSEEWENPYDKLHNALEEINDLLRERERLERRYQRLVESGTGSYKDFKESQEKNITNYENEIGKQKFIKNQRNKELDDLIAENPEMAKYITFEKDENGDRTIRIDWDAINAVTDEEEGAAIEEFYDDAKTILDGIYDAETAQEEAMDAIYEELQKGKDEYFNLEEQTKEALVNKYQDQIDEMSNVNDSINDTNSRILDAMQ